MEEDDLKQVITKYGLTVQLRDQKTMRRKQAAVISALEEAGYLAET